MTARQRDEADWVALERRQQARYRFEYQPADLDLARTQEDPYFSQLMRVRIEEARRWYQGGWALDLCCGAGDYARVLSDHLDRIVGLDFSPEMVRAAWEKASQPGRGNVWFAVGNARAVPLAGASVGMVYAFSCLYHIPRVEQVVAEVRRVLVPSGVALLEFGALHSLNTLVSRAMPDTAEACHVPLRRILGILKGTGFRIERRRSFQLLPMWGVRPRWMLPLLHPVWKRFLSARIAGRMIEERLSSLPVLRHVAFRHLMVVRKLS